MATLLVSSLLVVAACEKDVTVTMTVDYGLDGKENETITVDVGKPFADKLSTPTGQYVFGGWYLDGEQVTSDTLAPNKDFTVTAKWRVSYRVEYYLEKLTPIGQYELSASESLSLVGFLGDTVTGAAKSINGYTFDESNASNVKSATLNGNGVVLKLYYNRALMTVTFDKLIASATGSMQSISGKYGSNVTLPHVGFSSNYTFLGWNTASDGSDWPLIIEDGASLTLTDNITLYAQWQATYTIACYKEEYVGNTFDTEYVKVYEVSNTGIFGHGIGVVSGNPDVNKYVLDEERSDIHGVLTEEHMTFEAYFNLRTFTIRYMDDDTVVHVKYGSSHTVRTPSNDDANFVIHSYSNSPTGHGAQYNFGDVIKNIRADITLYPVSANIYYDDAGSGDYVEIRNKVGLGSAVLVKGGTRYEGWATISSSTNYLEFEVTVGSETLFGRISSEGIQNLFHYRGEEYGTYLYYDYIFNEFIETRMLTFDGYGLGVLAIPDYENGTERVVNYLVAYQYNEKNKDYDIVYGLPGSNNLSQTAFRIEKYAFGGADYANIDGYFMEFNADGESYVYTLYENGELYYTFLTLDGYGNAKIQSTDNSGNVNWGVTGIYRASNYYYNTGEQEYMFISDNEDVYPNCYFVLSAISAGSTIYVFIPKNAEYGYYTVGGANYPELYLDGYGGARYSIDADDDGRIGSYVIKNAHDGIYTIVIRFLDEAGGAMVVDIRIEHITDGVSYGKFTPYDGGFIVNDEGVLTDYIYDKDIGPESVIVIPEQVNGITVKKIAANVFNGLNITSVTFPATLEEIGDYAFSNGSSSAASPLQRATFLGSTPPVLGKDVFRWIKGSNFRIVVPDGAAEAYRTAPSWTQDDEHSSQKDGYAKFVTTATELANKPEFEIVDGVLVSYNNKDESPSNVHINIPNEVTEIAAGVFTNLTYITSVNLNNVTIIGDNAFYGCVNLLTVTFNPNTQSIGEWAFYNCYKIASVNLGGISEIGACAFARCLALTQVIIGENISYIGDNAFYECGRSESYDYDSDGELIEVVEMFDLIVEIAATTAPAMGHYVFNGSQARVYLLNYETAVSYVTANTWSTYVKYVRVHAQGEQQIWYSKSNSDGWMLTLGDRLVFDDNFVGLYKWIDSTTLRVTWVVYSEIADVVNIYEQTAHVVNGELVGLDLSWNEGASYTFVPTGATLTYTSDSGDTLEITFGTGTGKYNNHDVQFSMYGYRLRFEYNGYIYTVTLYDSNDTLSFVAIGTKITVETVYTAEDGSTITIYDGTYIRANGRLKDVNGVEIYTETQGWYLTKLSDNEYGFKWNHKTGNYYVVITLLTDKTFSYKWSIDSVVTVYHNAELGHTVTVTISTNNPNDIRISILFKTANGAEEQIAQILYGSDNSYTIKIDGVVDVEDLEGNSYQVPSTFNGTYTLTLHPDATNPTYELELLG